jgi:hypothetical protein
LIYFIQEGDNGPIKIGKAVSVERRLDGMQTAHHKELTILQVIPGGTTRESQIKKDLIKFKIRGEWFQPMPEVFEYMRRVRDIEYELLNGRPYAVLYRKDENEKIEICPFCGKRHVHGIGDGHRTAHCIDGSKEITADDGTVLTQDSGYILRTKKNVSKAIQRARFSRR